MVSGGEKRGAGGAPPAHGEGAPTRVGKYRVDHVIGRGAVGVVYKGYDEHIDRPLAIKTLRPEFLAGIGENDDLLRRFAVEARSAGRCLHPNIVTVFDFVEQDGAPYIVMEYVNAGTLDNVLKRGALPPVRQVGEIMAQLLFALGYAHSKGVIHRDVKPANILCPSASSIKVSDFGVAHLETLELTRPGYGGPVGTPNYMAPERFLGRPADARSDLFSAGIILFQLLTGAKPFVASDLAELLRLLMDTSPPSVRSFRPELWPELDAVVQRSLARNPDDRFQSADLFIDALNQAIEQRPPDNGAPLDLTALSHQPARESAGTTRQALNQTMADVLAPDTIDALSKTLARFLGPIARLVVKKASTQASDMDTFIDLLHREIKQDTDAAAFRAAAGRVLQVAPVFATTGPVMKVVSDAEIKAVTGMLLPLVGPVASVLVTRQAEKAVGREDFYRRLAEFIPSEQDRASFLALRTKLGGREGA
ncbi:serine/threonine-protein kinase [Mongoliimonas terrestris]|uniref:serine/threonine-protein kinase n=1 Tax=Mongoliimonas terrestris TaxID=1709001 RepID=UPI0009F9F071|nr:serine/threonine-protein kinase [Mongoliimonas terrestris]